MRSISIAALATLCVVILPGTARELRAGVQTRLDQAGGVGQLLTPTGTPPPSLNQHAGIFDPVRRRLILFGGAESYAGLHVCDLSAGAVWTTFNPSGPVGRKAHSAVYDPIRRRMIVFGGYGGLNYRNDVWALSLDGSYAWTEIVPAGPPPSGRMFTLAIYDTFRDRVVLFGGHPEALNDVWALSLGANPQWSQLQPTGTPPPPRWGHVGVFDPAGDRLIVFGGTASDAATHQLVFSPTPAWSTLPTTGSPPGNRVYGTGVFDPSGHRMLFFANDASGISGLDLGTYAWEQLPIVNVAPAPRRLHVSVYDAEVGRLLTHGGENIPSAPIYEVVFGITGNGPEITSFFPPAGEVGDEVTILGTQIVDVTQVRIGGVVATILGTSPLQVQVPEGATTGRIEVDTPAGSATSAEDYRVGLRVRLGAAVPDSGRVGDTFVLHGRHFAEVSDVRIGPAGSATFAVDSDSLAAVTIGSGAVSGPVRVTNPFGSTTSDFSFDVLPANPRAVIVGVRDVPRDQGGRVVVRWLASHLDGRFGTQVRKYRVWRRAPLALASGETAHHQTPNPAGMRLVGTEFWEPVGEVPAIQLPGYAWTAATHFDSTAAGNSMTAFFVEAMTDVASIFYASGVDSGYSIDNLAPAMPSPVAGVYGPMSVTLHWVGGPEPDRSHFRIYRGPTPSFQPGPGNLIASISDTGYVDTTGGPSPCYKISAVDVHGNESRFALVTPNGPTAVLAILESARAVSDRVELSWLSYADLGLTARVQRRVADGEWEDRTVIIGDGTGRMRYVDVDVESGRTYAYRLAIQDGPSDLFVAEVWVTVPWHTLSISRVAPNPAIGTNPTLHVTLGEGPAELEVLDVAGRRVLTRRLDGVQASQRVEIDATRLATGLYHVRLAQGERRASTRIAIVR